MPEEFIVLQVAVNLRVSEETVSRNIRSSHLKPYAEAPSGLVTAKFLWHLPTATIQGPGDPGGYSKCRLLVWLRPITGDRASR